MAGVARVGIDSINGVILNVGSPDVKANGGAVVRAGDVLPTHPGFGTEPPHVGATVTAGIASSSVKANGLGVVRGGDIATCLHIITGGSSDVDAGG